MGILEGIVIATIIIAAVWVGYHAWQESLHDTGEAHIAAPESLANPGNHHTHDYVQNTKTYIVPRVSSYS